MLALVPLPPGIQVEIAYAVGLHNSRGTLNLGSAHWVAFAAPFAKTLFVHCSPDLHGASVGADPF